MTWAQTTFAYCFLILSPLAAILYRARSRRCGKSGVGAFFAGGTLMVVAMIGCCILAIKLFPRYPNQHVSEWVANALTLPAVLLVTWSFWFPCPAPELRPFLKRYTVIFLTAYVAGIGLTYWATLWPYRKDLPWSATQIEERYSTDGFLPDYDYRLKAKISETDFKEYVEHYRLKNGSKHTCWLSSGSDAPANWCEPVDCYFRQEGDWEMHVTYCRGFIYVVAMKL